MIDRNTQRKIGFSGTIRSVQPRSNGNYWVKHDNDTKMDNAVTSLESRFVSPYGVTNINAMIDPDCKDKDLLALVTYISADERSGL